MKKILIPTSIAFLLLILMASTAFAAPAAKKLPFKGSIHAAEVYSFDFPTMYVTSNGSGNADFLGKYEFSYQITVNLLSGAGTGGSMHFIAANGDSLYADGTGQGGPSGTPNFNAVTENYVITGGTGRFTDATGSFTINRLVSTVTGISSGAFDGTIVLP
jgi:hypothetical protein